MTLRFRMFFQMCVCSVPASKIGRLLWRIGSFLPKKWKASFEEHWVHIVSEMWCSFTYGSSGTVFVSSAAAFVQQSITVMEMVSTNAHHTASISWVLQLKLIQLEMGLHWWVLQFTWQVPLSKEQCLLLNKLPSPSSKFNCCCTTSCALCLPIAGCHKGLNPL